MRRCVAIKSKTVSDKPMISDKGHVTCKIEYLRYCACIHRVHRFTIVNVNTCFALQSAKLMPILLCGASIEAMNRPPFDARDELYRKLYILCNQRSIRRKPKRASSESPIGETMAVTTEKNYLPGQPRIALQDRDIGKYLESELVTRDFDKLAPYLWLVAKSDASHISSLTHQVVRGRQIIVTEKPELHLIWIYDRVFIKPIPKYLLSHAFWEFYLIGSDSPIPDPLKQDIRKAALGFLRSYLHLIRHKSDFILATDDKLRLVPKHIRYAEFVSFIKAFETILDVDVAARYGFGELRLTQMNFCSKIFLRRFTYQKVHGQYGAYFARFYGPILFIFASFSVALAAMQVALAAQQFIEPTQTWAAFSGVSRRFAICTLVGVTFTAPLPLYALSAFQLCKAIFAIRIFHRQRSSRSQGVEGKSSLQG